MNKLYHVTTGEFLNNIKIGDLIQSSNDSNKFTNGIIDSCSLHPTEMELLKKSNEIHTKYDDLNQVYSLPCRERMDALIQRSSDFHGLSTSLNNALYKYLAFIREEIFEKTRINSFPEKPSRKKCVWLCSEISINQWWEDIRNTNSKIFEVELCSGANYLLADSELIKTETHSIKDFEKMAHNYWKGLDKDYQYGEFVVEGKMKVLNIFSSIEEI